ncbi:3-isopropylmalate dehydratase, large subunit [Sulfurimonas denitrificans DSM 1251]|jgi:3-isopropylmalate/(R)-2-methylmalate dehydratase large subunit|uniref:3-isopropylmalate dehydratase large subunit n=1 Tax=Sulfurimonas denitrificans (strain ATCC 33889 / DSM 1251) TaxID=326298 RepID=LEUC_SULDN|nr:3-isopropylmalate dehydratase large subunit [Sulfurimonas denitrificans]Q30NZ0.1 RecName: Full=3-isopropylmalate dehydratase large subunit; AltName: Full=Alpha-IPM isomerase; Short=IPMI; AltName: Full=Isopropylmalate isomerase [Sulfurimonas denitrificans DSM 1251]ABB45291.1 3-isopropylmalate dehydratase, large subunit [Sulfurimonas denitrificans DSM 1251]MDD3442090.1 3-isopropylmalate dehydratase large subunit [Sulfurimonas denitrificans]
MAQTITEKIFSQHVGRAVFAGEIIRCNIDMVIGNDITTPISIKAFEDSGATKLANPDGFSIVLDHFIPAKDIASANQARISRDFAKKYSLKNFFDEKDMGIEHALLPEKGLVVPGDVIIGADSHTCTHGALGAFSTGMGSTDLAFAMITGGNWFKVPESIKVNLSGKPSKYTTGKDIILEIIRLIGVDGALYKTLEFTGSTIEHLSIDDRFSMCNMAIEAGAKSGIVAYDETTKAFLADKNLAREPRIHYSDADASYVQILNIDVASLDPVIAYPFLPSNGHSVVQAQKDNIKIDQAFIGSCTNGRLSDLKVAAEILKGKRVHPDVRLIVTPGTQMILREANKLGYIDIIVDAGGVVSNPTCGACLGGYMGILGDNEVAISTTNRNFVGRMGSRSSKVYLANSAVAAISAIKGYITDPR